MRALLLLACLISPAAAQDQPPPLQQTPFDQALSEKLLNEIYLDLQCRQGAIAARQQAQAEIAALKKQIEELTKKDK